MTATPLPATCCMWACHRPVAGTRTAVTTVDGETFPVVYRLCRECLAESDAAAASVEPVEAS